MSLSKLSLGGNNDVIYEIFPPRESLVNDIPARTGISKSFFTVHLSYKKRGSKSEMIAICTFHQQCSINRK